jgi:hypothetical protein
MRRASIGQSDVARVTALNRRSVLKGSGAGAAATLLAKFDLAASSAAAQEATSSASPHRFLVIRRYTLAPGVAIADLMQRTGEEFVPILRELEGFVAYYNVDLGDGAGATISIFSSEESASASTAQAAAWVQDTIAELVQGPPQIVQGAVLLDVTAADA